jgi:aryl-alcohol dehydrogenase-like predicted oxidoreductase
MKALPLPNTQLSVSPLCLGTNQFGTGHPHDAAAAILDTFFEAGGNFIDTARSYSDWIPTAPRAASETLLGALLRNVPRSAYVLATKGCEFDYRGDATRFRVTPELLQEDLNASLAALQLKFIDLYWLHRDDVSLPVGAIVDALISQQRAGLIRYFGCSNWTVGRIKEAQRYARSIGHTGFVASQPIGGLAVPDPDVLQNSYGTQHFASGFGALQEDGVTMIPYSSQSMGFFSKLLQGGADSLNDSMKALYLRPQNLRRAEVVVALAKRYAVPVSAVVLSYMTSQPVRTIPIIGVNGPEQMRAAIQAAELKLSAADLSALETA